MNENTSTPHPPHSGPGPRRLYRSADDRKISGVAGGLARHFGVDPAFVRLGFVALALFGGSGVVLYAVAWLIIPLDRAETTRHERSGDEPSHDDTGVAQPVVDPAPKPDQAPPPVTFQPMV